jgi:flagellar hook assembly protein FlgD
VNLCGQQLVQIYDERGEKVATLCGNQVFASGTVFSLKLSDYQPSPSGLGGSVSIELNGQLVTVWDGKDSTGTFVPNGFYHVVVLETTPDGKEVKLEKDVLILNDAGATISLNALPNFAHPGDLMQIIASFAGTPADATSNIKIYTVSGELVRSLTISSGAATWDIRNNDGQFVSSGIYFLVLDGRDPNSGLKKDKIVKILVTH